MERSFAWTWVGAAVLLLALAAPGGRRPCAGGSNDQRNARQRLTEFVLPGQTVESWKELVTSSVFVQPVPVAAFVQRRQGASSPGTGWTA